MSEKDALDGGRLPGPVALVSASPERSTALDLAVDLGFAILLLVCGIRYFSYHELGGEGMIVLALAVGTGIAYAWAVLPPRRPVVARAPGAVLRARQGIGLLLATTFWLPLVVLAPSFGWCAFALFFALHRVLSGRAALVLSTAIVVAISIGLFLMSKGQDLGLVLGPFFGGLVLAYAYWALDRALAAQRRLNAELVETREQLARSERETGALIERGRLASELHDTVVQRTASALLLLESRGLGGETSAATDSEVRETLRESLVETRQLMHGLSRPHERTASLTDVLRAQAESDGASFVASGTERFVPEATTHALQRVVREALINVGKHANAEHSRVTLSYFPDAIGVDIADDGTGFSPPHSAPNSADGDADGEGVEGRADSEPGGFGIQAMTWRMHNLGGRLTIESQPGLGTVVAAVVPLPSEEVIE